MPTPSPTYPPAQASPVCAVQPDRGAPVARHAERAAPHVRDPVVGDRGEQVDQGPVQPPEDRVVAVERGPRPRRQEVRRAAAAEDQPVVGGALAVDDEVPVVAERLAAAQPDLVPHVGRQRLGGDDQRVHGRDRAALPGERGGVALGGPDHDLRADGAVRGHRPARLDRGDGGALVDPYAAPLDGVGQAAHQPGGVDRRAVRGVRRAQGAGGPQDVARLGRVEEPQVVLAAAPGPGVGDLGPGPAHLGGGADQADGAALGDVGVDALGGRDPHDLVDGGPHRGVLGERALAGAAVQTGDRSERGREERGAPAPVASGRAVPRDLGLEHDDPQRRVGLGEVVGGPQAGVAGTDDDHVGVGVTGQRGARVPGVARGLVPQGEPGVAAQRTPHE